MSRFLALTGHCIMRTTTTTTTTTPNHKNASAETWFVWALDQFNLFHGAPRPTPGQSIVKGDPGDDVADWIPKFERWLASGAANRRVRTVGQCLLRSWNDELRVEGAGDVWTEYGGMDDTNRAGLRRVLEHVRYF